MIYEIETIIVACIIFEKNDKKLKISYMEKYLSKIFLSNIINIPNPYE